MGCAKLVDKVVDDARAFTFALGVAKPQRAEGYGSSLNAHTVGVGGDE